MQQSFGSVKSPAISSDSLDKFASSYSVSSSPGDRLSSHHEPKSEQRKNHANLHQPNLYFVTSSQKRPTFIQKSITPAESPIAPSSLESPSILPINAAKNEKTESPETRVKEITPSVRSPERKGIQSSWLRRFCLHWFTAYRVLIALTIITNAGILVHLITLALPFKGIIDATAANLLAAVLVRQEDLINISFGLFAKISSSVPFGLRRIVADFHHYGGVHIGTAMSALIWYILYVVINTCQCVRRVKQGSMTGWYWADIGTSYAFLTFIILISVTAIPRLRESFHNSFEYTHRFAGWASLIVLWVNAGISTIADPNHVLLYKTRSIWLLTVATFLIILPWLRIRRIPIKAQIISPREIKVTFPYTNMPYISTSRFSLSPLMEWHAFATIPSADGFSADIIISAAGDWTKSIIANPPKRLWIRHPAAANFLAFTPLFNSVLLVATGAGIGPMLSLLSSPAIKTMIAQEKKIRVMWCVYDPNAPHWAFVQDVIRKVDPFPKIFDSKTGRPDVAFEARYLARVNHVEAVMVVSNKKVTNEVVWEVKTHGGAAYGAVFDS